ncbi:MAG TPA: hypothetical protein VKK79_05440, partial [Candidatus Lokiarchaeia archaeon]|nr:hypothetical protein [Candidatus Lokiarchaeia archaeon]
LWLVSWVDGILPQIDFLKTKKWRPPNLQEEILQFSTDSARNNFREKMLLLGGSKNIRANVRELVLAEVARNTSIIAPKYVGALFEQNPTLVDRLLKNSGTKLDSLRQLMNYNLPQIREKVARKLNVPLSILEMLLNWGNTEIKYKINLRFPAPPSVDDFIISRGSIEAKQALLQSPSLSRDHQRRLREEINKQQYYIGNFNFDPANKFFIGAETDSYFYEETFPLTQDPGLNETGITVAARVTCHGQNMPVNHIVFKRGSAERLVKCVHTAVCNLTRDEINQMGDQFEEKVIEYAQTAEHQPVQLPAEDHFVALKSYVAGIAELGIANVMTASYYSENVNPELLPFGFNTFMQKQICTALRELAPLPTREMIANHVLSLFNEVSLTWLEPRLDLLDSMYNLKDALLTNFAVFEALYSQHPLRKLEEWALEFEHVDSRILPFIATGGREESWGDIAAKCGDREAKLWILFSQIVKNHSLPLRVRHWFLGNAVWVLGYYVLGGNETAPPEKRLGTEELRGREFWRLLLNPNLPPHTTEQLLDIITPEQKRDILDRSRLPPELAILLTQEGDAPIQIGVYLNSEWNSEFGRILLRVLPNYLKKELLTIPYVSEWIIEELARDPDFDVRLIAFLHARMPPEFGMQLASEDKSLQKYLSPHHPKHPVWAQKLLQRTQ